VHSLGGFFVPPKASEVRRIAREELEPTLAGMGFRHGTKHRREWTRTHAEALVTFRLLFSPWNYGDGLDGDEFTGELEVATTATAERAANLRLFHGLTDAQRETFRLLQNLVIAKIPLDEEELDRLPPEWQSDRLVRVAPRWAPYPAKVDVWFRYHDEVDVRRWCRFIAEVLPGCVEQVVRYAHL
jgi:hypothetical protein